MRRQTRINHITVTVTQRTMKIKSIYRVTVFRLDLLRLNIPLRTGNLGGTGFTRVHTTVSGIKYSTITTRGTLTCNTLTRLFTERTEGGHFLTKQSNFGEEGIHG